MKTKHTQGEWKLSMRGIETSPTCETDRYTYIQTKRFAINLVVPMGMSYKEFEANAKLIAAAPDLLEALIDMVKMYKKIQPSGGYQGYYETAKEAIKKATE